MPFTNPNLAKLPPQVQQILPLLGELNFEQRFSIIDYLYHIGKQTIHEQEIPLSRESIAKKRLGFFSGQMTISDDFDDYLGDDFWFPKDDILYK